MIFESLGLGSVLIVRNIGDALAAVSMLGAEVVATAVALKAKVVLSPAEWEAAEVTYLSVVHL